MFLRFLGYSILKSRFVVGKGTGRGEIDIIAKRNKQIIFVEVKKRKTFDLAAQSVFYLQRKRIEKSAEVFISKNPKYQNFDFRFDVIVFNKFYGFRYIKNAWIM